MDVDYEWRYGDAMEAETTILASSAASGKSFLGRTGLRSPAAFICFASLYSNPRPCPATKTFAASQ